jgi:hypothetical protein
MPAKAIPIIRMPCKLNALFHFARSEKLGKSDILKIFT